MRETEFGVGLIGVIYGGLVSTLSDVRTGLINVFEHAGKNPDFGALSSECHHGIIPIKMCALSHAVLKLVTTFRTYQSYTKKVGINLEGDVFLAIMKVMYVMASGV